MNNDRTVKVPIGRQATHGANHLTNRLVELLLRLPRRCALDLSDDAPIVPLVSHDVDVSFDVGQLLLVAPSLATSNPHTQVLKLLTNLLRISPHLPLTLNGLRRDALTTCASFLRCINVDADAPTVLWLAETLDKLKLDARLKHFPSILRNGAAKVMAPS